MRDFTPTIAADDVVDLRRRLERVRWAGRETSPDQGIGLDTMRRLVDRWRDGYDWDRLRARLTALPQVRGEIDGLDVHAIHLRSSRPDATPLLLGHGWPSTCWEFDTIAPLLAEPSGDGPAFHVVVPSLPGYGWSGKPTGTGWGAERTADSWVALMAALGYDRFLLHGGDWGAIVGTELARRHPDRLTGLHLSMPIVAPTPDELDDVSETERRGLERENVYRRKGFGYALIQHTRPQTLGYGLDDSPVALLAWIAEKLLAWAGRDDAGRSLLSDDAVLDIVSIYWLTQTGASSARLYFESLKMDRESPIEVACGCTIFRDEMLRPPRSAVARRYTDLRSWAEEPLGGHFPAAEVPDALARRLREFATLLDD